MAAATHDEILKTFRQELFDEGVLHEGDSIGTDDETLLRFLRARKFNLAQSKTMITNAQEWRKTLNGTGIDHLYSEIDPFDYQEREAIFDIWPLFFHKTDKKGRPLNVHTFGGVDLPKLYKTCTPERHWHSVIVNAECLPREVLPASSRLAGRPIGTVFVIVDLKGFSLAKFWQMKSLARQSFQISQDYFPETMGQLAIVNAPTTFAFIWSMIKPWLSKETAEKVDILGHDYKKVLLELIDADSLPTTLGGNCVCEEGCHLSSAGPWLDGRVGWGPKSKVNRAKKDSTSSSAATPDTGSSQHLDTSSSVGNDTTPPKEMTHTRGSSYTAKPNSDDAQEDESWRAEKGLHQETVESQAEVVVAPTVTTQA
ncbi:CRAL-TRIO domain-containing protein [Mycena maculata]|uniref:CRAL-TRIO domain-containing protein n=1 Tax=Mycena maculata TaxID=230809 RepID=A0AAD7K8L1_9AGAR|nr:CRAL-TRIO domain-containing protein [Mycena maculata]